MKNPFRRPELIIASRDAEVVDIVPVRTLRKVVTEGLEPETDEHLLVSEGTTMEDFRAELRLLEEWVTDSYSLPPTKAKELAARIHFAIENGSEHMNSSQRHLYGLEDQPNRFLVERA